MKLITVNFEKKTISYTEIKHDEIEGFKQFGKEFIVVAESVERAKQILINELTKKMSYFSKIMYDSSIENKHIDFETALGVINELINNINFLLEE